MNIDKFTRAISLVVELQDIADREIDYLQVEEPQAKEVIQLASKLSCRISDVYSDLLEYVSSETIRVS